MAHHSPEEHPVIHDHPVEQADLFLTDLYRQLAHARSVIIEEAIADARDLPEPPAETLTLAAAALAHIAGVPGATTPRASLVARRLTAEARRIDPRAGALAEGWLTELESIEPMIPAELLHETAESLAWASAVLRHLAAALVDALDGNAEQLELAWMCLTEAGALLMAADRIAVDGRAEV
jgi:hypothetical protein